MIIKRSIEKEGNIMPEAYNLLNNLPEEALQYKSYNYLHPIGIYNKSLSRIKDAFLDVINQLEQVEINVTPSNSYSKEPVRFESKELLKAQKELLHSIQSHFDDCYHILKVTSIYPNMDKFNSNTKKIMQRSAYKWLDISKHPTISYFQGNIQEYKSFIDSIVNKIKHEHGRLRDIILINEYEKRLGYFIETSRVDREGESFSLPDPKIHKNGDLFSYSRDLSFHFYNLYKISYHLKNALIKSFKIQYNLEIADNFYLKEDSIDFINIARKIYERNLQFFPKEYQKPVPIIELSQNDSKTLILHLDKDLKLNSDFFGIIKYGISYTPDSITKNFVLPKLS